MEVKKLKKVNINIPKFSVDDNAIHESLSNHPAMSVWNRHRTHALISKSGGGKTSLALSLLLSNKKGSRVYRKRVQHYVIFMPANSRQSLDGGDPFEGEVSYLFDELNFNNLNDVYESIKQWSQDNQKTVLFLDDVTSQLKDKNVERLLSTMSFNSRHLKLSIIITSQVFIKIPPGIRRNLSTIILWQLPNKRENKSIYDELLHMDDSEWNTMYNYVHKDALHNFLTIDVVNNRFFKNFDEELILNQSDSGMDSDVGTDEPDNKD